MATQQPLSAKELAWIDAYWRAANYLSVGQIYLYDNPLLKAPLSTRHVKPRLIGPFVTPPGLTRVPAHVKLVARARGSSIIYIACSGCGGPGVVANAYREGTYREIYPAASPD